MAISKFIPDSSYQAAVAAGPWQQPEVFSRGMEPGGAYQVTCELSDNPTPENLHHLRQQYPDYRLGHGGRTGLTALTVAISKESIPLIRSILDEAPDLVNAGWGDEGEPYLHTAINLAESDLSLKIVKEFLSRGARINLANRRGETALQLALENETHEKVARFLLKKGGVVYKSTILPKPTFSIFFPSNQSYSDSIVRCSLAEANPYKKMKKCFSYAATLRALNRQIDVLRVPSILLNDHLHSTESKSLFSCLPKHILVHTLNAVDEWDVKFVVLF